MKWQLLFIFDWTETLKTLNINSKVISKCPFMLTFINYSSPLGVSTYLRLVLWNGTTKCTLFFPSPAPSWPSSFLLFYLSDWHRAALLSQRFERFSSPWIQNTTASWTFDGGWKAKESQKHLSIKTSQAGFRCSSPELHQYSKGFASLFLPLASFSCLAMATEERKP